MQFLPYRLGRTAALIIAAGFVAHAAGDGNLAVTVTSAAGKPLAGATITVSSPTQIGGNKTFTTDSQGKARFLRLAPGSFKVQVSADGYQSQTINNVDVLVDQTAQVNAKMVPVGSATVEVVSSVPLVDTTTVTAGTQVTQDDVQSLPIARNQLATLTLAPGVVSVGGNPSLAAGLNRDNFGGNGARNNTYMVDGVDMTSPETGTYRTTIPQELIANQDIKTGAITAEYSARAGLFSNVTTVAGSNDWHGGVTYQFRNPSMYNAVGRFKIPQTFSKLQDTTVYFEGPIIKDKLWIVASGQAVKDTANVSVASSATLTPGETRTSTLNDEKRYFVKLTWTPAAGHTLVGSFMRNPSVFDNLGAPTVVTARAIQTERGGSNYNLAYTWQTAKFILDVKLARHEESDTTKALLHNLGAQIDLNVDPAGGAVPVINRTFGNAGAATGRDYRRDIFRVDGTFLFDLLGGHTLKTGIQQGKDQLTQAIFIDNGGSQYNNLGALATGGGPTYSYVDGNYGGSVPGTISRMKSAINNQAAYAAIKTSLDTNHDGSVDDAELGAYRFSELFDASRPSLGYLGYRITLDSKASSTPKMEYQGAYVQDQWQIGRVTFSPGFRIDKYTYKADNGQSLFKTDWAFAPRIGATWDVAGDGRTKAYAYWGRYIDPIKLDMVRFTGSLTSSVRLEQIRINNTWVTENTRGGSKVVDAVFADTFKLPKTDEFRMGLAKDFGNSWSVEGTYTYRRDYDLVEDWDPTLYADAASLEAEARSVFGIPTKKPDGSNYTPTATEQNVINAFRALVINPNYFAGGGFTGQQNIDRVNNGTLNFVLANLPGGFRYFNTFDLTVTRKLKDHWGGFASWTSVRARGNSQSSGNADFQGDLARWDPRLPYVNGALDGSVNWVGKLYGYYKFDGGFLVGIAHNLNSGYHYSNGRVFSTRVLLDPIQYTNANFSPAKVTADPNFFNVEQQGRNMTPRIEQTDLHLQYDWTMFTKFKGQVFADVFNLFNRQNGVDLSEGPNIRGAAPVANTPYTYQVPRRYSLGLRFNF